MLYIEESSKSAKEVVKNIEDVIANYKFGILHMHNPKETLISKGLEFTNECYVLDVCNPKIAKEILDIDMSISSMVPCKISVYEDKGQTYIAMNSITQLIDDINPDLVHLGEEAQALLLKLIEEVK